MDKTCQFCNKEFSTLPNLRAHLKSSKKCISSRLIEDEEQSVKIVSFNCEYCNKEFTSKYNLSTHLNTCKIKSNQTQAVISKDELNELIRLREENKRLIDENNRLIDENNRLKAMYELLEHNAIEKEKEIYELSLKVQMKEEVLKCKEEVVKAKDDALIIISSNLKKTKKEKTSLISVNNNKTITTTNNDNSVNNTTNSNNTTNNTINIYLDYATMNPINSDLAQQLCKETFKESLTNGNDAISLIIKRLNEHNFLRTTSDDKYTNSVVTVCKDGDKGCIVRGTACEAIYKQIKPLENNVYSDAYKKQYEDKYKALKDSNYELYNELYQEEIDRLCSDIRLSQLIETSLEKRQTYPSHLTEKLNEDSKDVIARTVEKTKVNTNLLEQSKGLGKEFKYSEVLCH
jgi:hypothetical protein